MWQGLRFASWSRTQIFCLSCVCDKIPCFWQETTTLFNSIPSTALRHTFYLGLHQIYNAMKINCQILNLNNPGNIWWGARGWWTWENASCGTGNIWGPRWHGWKPTVFKTIAVWRRWWNLWSTWTRRPRDVRSARGVRYNEMLNWIVHTSFDWCWNNCRSQHMIRIEKQLVECSVFSKLDYSW